jgi:redox-regulated HSP33 family molecular chaperone
MLSGIILSAAFGFRAVQAETVEGARLAQEARVSVMKLGVGERARVEVKLRDDTKLKGYVSAAGADSFTVTDGKTGASTVVAYGDVAQVKKQGNGLSTMTKVLIGGAVAAGVIVGWQVLKPALCDGGAQHRGPC